MSTIVVQAFNAGGLQGELTRRCNRIPKYVRTLTEVGWKNSQFLGPDVPAAVKKLRATPGGEIRVWGSTELIRTLAEHDLVDERSTARSPCRRCSMSGRSTTSATAARSQNWPAPASTGPAPDRWPRPTT